MEKTKKRHRKPSSFYRRQDMWGVIMMTPWLLGTVLFFLIPLVRVVIFSFHEVTLDLGAVHQKWVGLTNYIYVLRTHPSFYSNLIEVFTQAVPNTVLIIFFSLFAAVLLNGKYKFRGAARVLFFLPIVLATDLISINLAAVSMEGIGGDAASAAEGLSGAAVIVNFLIEGVGLPVEIISVSLDVIANVFETIKLSGVQTLIFLAGLQSISPSMYEVAKMEGATGYETFWKVTLPTVSPLILTNLVYTITDNLMRTNIIEMIRKTGFNEAQYGYSSAMSVVFLGCTLVLIGVASAIVGKVVFYND